MIRVDGHSYYCCEICNDSYAYVHIKEDGKELWVSSYIDANDGISVSELREEVRLECLKRNIDVSKIECFEESYIGDWEYKECLDSF